MASNELRRGIALAREAWPDVEVPEDLFEGYVLARAEGADVAGLRLTDLYLACACSLGDRRALAAFDRAFLAPVEGIVRGVAGAGHLASDVAQVVRARLLGDESGRRRISDYRGTGALAGWVRVVALRIAANARRGERAAAAASAGSSAPPTPPAIEDMVLRARYGDAFNDAFRRSFRALGAEDRLALRLHYADGRSLDQVAAALDLSRATAGRRLLSARTRLREETLRILGDELGASREELESVLAAIRSHLDVSFGALVTAA
jgi:RNA polymerase sigma-70 factor (ECF subfamily)